MHYVYDYDVDDDNKYDVTTMIILILNMKTVMILREMKSIMITTAIPSYQSKPPLQQSAHAQSDVRLSDIAHNTSENSPYKTV